MAGKASTAHRSARSSTCSSSATAAAALLVATTACSATYACSRIAYVGGTAASSPGGIAATTSFGADDRSNAIYTGRHSGFVNSSAGIAD